MPILTPQEVLARISAVSIMKNNASDADASRCVSIYPTLKGDGSLVKAGTRISFNGDLYRSRLDLWDTEENTPDRAPNIWEKVMYKQGIRIIPEQITAEHPFWKGDRGWWNGALYESILEIANTYTPDAYPAGWKLLRENKN